MTTDPLTRTRREGSCLVWTGALQSNGYGSVGIGNKKTALAHRVSYEMHVGPIPDGLQIDHVKDRGCRNRACVNPAHLEAVTPAENIRRTGHGSQTHCKRGHPLSGPNLIIKKRGARATNRNCRTCAQQASRDFRDRRALRAANVRIAA